MHSVHTTITKAIYTAVLICIIAGDCVTIINDLSRQERGYLWVPITG